MRTITEHIIVDETIPVPSEAFPIYGHSSSMVTSLKVHVSLKKYSDFDRKTIIYEIKYLASNSRIWSTLMHYESEISSEFPSNIKILDPIGMVMNSLGVALDGVREALHMVEVSDEN